MKEKETKKAAVEKEESEGKKESAKAYHVSKREDGKWQVKLAKGKVAIKLFDTKLEAIAYTENLSKNQGGAAVRVHASKGANKGKIQKL